MAHIVEPKVYLFGRPSLDWDAIEAYLRDIGGLAWLDRVKFSGIPHGELITEIEGRLCYKSWDVKPELNLNIGQVRTNSTEYIKHIVESMHGSVTAHSMYNFIFSGVSRVFTHELITHQVGAQIADGEDVAVAYGNETSDPGSTARSQESLRYVRQADIGIRHSPVLDPWREDILEYVKMGEHLIARIGREVEIDGKKFPDKKIISSALRDILMQGMTTEVGWSANIRALRHIIYMRTNPGAEQEIRNVFGQVAEIMKRELPALFADFTRIDGGKSDGWWTSPHPKI